MGKTDFEHLALGYHQKEPKGKIAIATTKPLDTQDDLSLAYSPGVAGPCRAIEKDINHSFSYTARGNLVAVISNGTAVLGLGSIGPYAAKPVMEGKAMLFKKFADIDVFDIEVAEQDPDQFIKIVKALEPTFGGINLEDIKAPECFYIEEKLRETMDIPVFHDDQHGTAIIASSAFINACEISHRKMENVKVVFSGAGAAAIACAGLFKQLGVKSQNIWMCDSKGVIHSSRQDLNEYKKKFINDSGPLTMEDALKGADAFVGVSTADILTPQMLLSMNKHPIVFALANPDPEIKPELAFETRDDVIIATGRSDYPNQVNNVLGFPYIFRGALDVRATKINDEMKLAAVRAIANLAKEDVPEEVMAVYKKSARYKFGKDYLIPKPVDQRVLLRVAPAVAQAAMDSNVARVQIDMNEYHERVNRLLGTARRMIRVIRKEIAKNSAQTKKKPKIVMPFAFSARVLKAAKQAFDSGDVDICLLGKKDKIRAKAQELGIANLDGIEIINPITDKRTEDYAQSLYERRMRKGVSRSLASQLVMNQDYFAATMVYRGEADGMINGISSAYSSAIRPILNVIGIKKNSILAGVYMIVLNNQIKFFADCTVNIDPTAEQLAEIAIATADLARGFITDPIRIAMLSYASFGASKHPSAQKVADATRIINVKQPGLEVDGEMQADIALNKVMRSKEFPFSSLKEDANVLVFPDLGSANISYKLLTQLANATPIGPILVGLQRPAYSVQRTATVSEIVNMIYISAHHSLKLDLQK